jgi:hypothetical protein
VNELDVLRAARKRISQPKDWCQGSFGDLDHFDGRGPRCLVGALIEFDELSGTVVSTPALSAACPGGVIVFNDTHSHAEVLALLDDVIARLEEETSGDPLPPIFQVSDEPFEGWFLEPVS